MESRKPSNGAKRVNGALKAPAFNAQAFLDSAGVAKTIVQYARGDAIFTQGDACEQVMYIQSGGVKLSVLSKTGREAVVAMLGPGDFALRRLLFVESGGLHQRLPRELIERGGGHDQPE